MPGVATIIVPFDHQLRVAIANKRLILFSYDSVERAAEPHDYGVQNGIVRLFVYQLRSTPFKQGWRLLDVAKIERLVVLDETFAGSRGLAYRQHTQWDMVFARVE